MVPRIDPSFSVSKNKKSLLKSSYYFLRSVLPRYYITLQKMCEITNVTFEMPYTTNE